MYLDTDTNLPSFKPLFGQKLANNCKEQPCHTNKREHMKERWHCPSVPLYAGVLTF